MKTLFVTSSGTGTGKTYVARALAAVLTARGLSVTALKPVVSGFSWDEVEDTDTALLLRALGREPTPDAVEACSPWRFEAPLSPDMAARREGRTLDFEALV
ncbi:MAG: ATP-dependent dethiobiotin synthetase BioD, partial [Rhodospirillales bacterium]